jgi:hypothetical protein
MLPKKWAWQHFPYKSRCSACICALAHNFVHKNCAEAGSARRAKAVVDAAKNFIDKIYPIEIKDLP